jgi:hypothetical protein
MVNYPCYCSKCDKITGHDTHGLASTCVVCGKTGRAPYVRWALLPVLLFLAAALPIYIIATSIFAQYVLLLCVVVVTAVLLYMRFQNSRYRVLLQDLVAKCTSAFKRTKLALKLQ